MRRALGWAGGRLRGPEASVSGRMCSGGGGGDGADRRFPLAGRVAVITGSTDGIGLAVARRLGRDGAHVVLSSRQQENVTRAVASLQAEGLSVSGTVCHIGKTEDRERLVLLGPYNVSKTAILGLTKTLALELKPKGIRVNCLAPGLIKTNFSQVVRIGPPLPSPARPHDPGAGDPFATVLRANPEPRTKVPSTSEPPPRPPDSAVRSSMVW
uniref:Dehydrogenase/reductase 2 n=1 Tax=Ornithorhynchus anatinus TaxID=9258 RepID=A0A6I8N2X2_ORNAN